MFTLNLASGARLSRQGGMVTLVSTAFGTTELSHDTSARAMAHHRYQRNRCLKAPFYAFKDSSFLRWLLSK